MARLPKSLIKKYGISKKAWSVFKGKKSPKKTRRVNTMAKKRTSYRRRKSKVNSILTGPVGKVAGGFAYGIAREKISQAITPITSKLPFGNASDEVGMIIAAALLHKPVTRRLPIAKEFFNATFYIEGASLGEMAADGTLTMGTKSTSNNYGY